jgi:hypothetical protein
VRLRSASYEFIRISVLTNFKLPDDKEGKHFIVRINPEPAKPGAGKAKIGFT